jgi:NAD-dependent deacetylase
MMPPIHLSDYPSIVFFTGAGMSAESGVPTYRGSGGIWHRYRWQEFASQDAFDNHPEKVLDFHDLRRKSVLPCHPHAGHHLLAIIEQEHPHATIVTQNIDGMHQRAGSKQVIELHGSMWRVRCGKHGKSADLGETFTHRKCPDCGAWLRPDIIWFGDYLDPDVMNQATAVVGNCDLFISIGTSGVVYPAAGFPQIAKERGARCIEINPEPNEASHLYPETIREPASTGLLRLFDETFRTWLEIIR